MPLLDYIYQTHANLRMWNVTDATIIGDAAEPGDAFVHQHDTYTWYFAAAFHGAPDSILELGVRFGYAGIAMLQGALWAGVHQPSYLGIDAETDGHPCIDIARHNILKRTHGKAGVKILNMNTRDVGSLDGQLFNMIHVDGDHSKSGILNELRIAGAHLTTNGCILVDDIDTPHVRLAAEDFCGRSGMESFVLPTFHGTMLIS